MKVLLIRNAFQHDAGGAEQYALNLAITLKNLEHQPILITKVNDILTKATSLGVKTIKGRWYDPQGWSRGYYLRKPLIILWYMWVIVTRQIDVVHPQGRDDFVFATQAAKLLGKRVVWTDHADLKYLLDAINHPNPRMRKWIINAAQHTAAIVCVSEYEKDSILDVAPEIKDKLTVIHNGVFKPTKLLTPVTKTAELVVGTNARLVPTKGIAELIEGFANAKLAKSELWLLGGYSNNLDKYKKIAKIFGVEKQTRFIGYVANPNDFVTSMDIFVHASYLEAFSLAIIEAAMLGRPIIATNVGGTPEIINRNTGILIESHSPDEITQALKELAFNKNLRSRLGRSAQRRAESEFIFEVLVRKKLIPLYGGRQ